MVSKFSKAFTLLEVLITVAILSTAITFLFRSFTAVLSSAQFSQYISLACYLSEDKLWEIEQANTGGSGFPESGSAMQQNKNFNWRYEIQDTDHQDLKELNFIVSWKVKTREKEYLMEFLTYLPVKKK